MAHGKFQSEEKECRGRCTYNNLKNNRNLKLDESYHLKIIIALPKILEINFSFIFLYFTIY